VILGSHSMDVIKKYCTRTAYMKKGQLVYFGETQKAIDMYIADNQ
jgi:ABC-2 type transport system ATP-binding protein